MKIVRARITPLNVPFVEGFAHATKERRFSDTLVVQVEADDGTVGWGEGIPRPYVSGETVQSVVTHLQEVLWPRVRGGSLREDGARVILQEVDTLLGGSGPTDDERESGVIAHHSARCAMEIALVDCALRRAGRGLGELLGAEHPSNYSAVLTQTDPEKTRALARRFSRFGLTDYKIKVAGPETLDCVAAARDELGPDVGIRLDANGVWTLDEALEFLTAVAPYDVLSCEEPLGRERMSDLPELTARSPVPVMLDESLVSLQDALWAVSVGACDHFNIRLSKCGGIGRSLAFMQIAQSSGLGFQMGSHVGETSILSAAARHVAFSAAELRHLEGSYGTLLMADDVVSTSVRFGNGGRAPLLKGPGLGIDVESERVEEWSTGTLELA
jgi:muconate cycloisomerase